MTSKKEMLPIVDNHERDRMLQAAQEECQRTKRPVTIQFAQRYEYSEGRTRVEKFKYIFEFEARGIPYPEVYQKDGRDYTRLGRGNPGVYLASIDSTIQRTLEQMDKDRRKNFTPRDRKNQKSGPGKKGQK